MSQPVGKKTRQRGSRSRGQRIGLAVSVLTLILSAALVAVALIAWRRASRVPAISIPTPRLPSPNAYDTLLAAARALVGGNTYEVAALPGEPLPPGASRYMKRITLAQAQSLLKQNAAAIRLMRRAFRQQYWAPQENMYDLASATRSMRENASFRGLSRFLEFDSRTRAAEGRWSDAAQASVDAVRLGVLAPHGRGIIGALVGVACEGMGRRELWRITPHLGAAEARSWARDMEGILATRYTLSPIVQQEEWSTHALVLAAMHDRKHPYGFIGFWGPGGDPPKGPIQTIETVLRMLRQGGPAPLLRAYHEYMAAIRTWAGKRYGLHAPRPRPRGYLGTLAGSAPETLFLFDYAKNDTQDDLLLVSLALRGYRAANGRYPVSLAQLVPKYLSSVPQDEFAVSGTLRYQRNGTGYVLYSVGPDGKDDGGTPILNPAGPPGGAMQYRRYPMQNSVGDIVARVNL